MKIVSYNFSFLVVSYSFSLVLLKSFIADVIKMKAFTMKALLCSLPLTSCDLGTRPFRKVFPFHLQAAMLEYSL